MILLDKNEYYKLTESLKKVTINNLFARSVIENCVEGKVYVDDGDHPQTFYILHPYGMSLLFGDCHNKEFNESFREYSLNTKKTQDNYEWIQAFPPEWDIVLAGLFNDSMIKSSDNIETEREGFIELNTRINFKFNQQKYFENKEKQITPDIKIIPTDKQIFNEMKGSVVPIYFWDSADDFFNHGAGFSLFYNDKLASTAYSAYVLDNKLEIGIETVEEFRGKGFAKQTCSALIDYCIENEYEPVWGCRIENTGSYKLAQKLGFEPCAEIPYYRLCK